MNSDCSMCSGSYCAIHFDRPCDCDVIDRHGSEPCPLNIPDDEHPGMATLAEIEDWERRNPSVEPLPASYMPQPHVIDALLAPPELDAAGRIVGGTFAGMTPDEVLRDRDEYRRMAGE